MLTNSKWYYLQYNREFLKWYQDRISAGYISYLDISDMQKMIDYITFWYEMKFPERVFSSSNQNNDFMDINGDIFEKLSFTHLMYILDKDVYDFIKCNYRSQECVVCENRDESGNFISTITKLYLKIINKITDEEHAVVVDAETGLVIESKFEFNPNCSYLTIDKMLYLLNKEYKDICEFDDIKETVKNHKVDLVLRKILLNLIAEKILSNDIVDDIVRETRYYEFISEFNYNIPDLKLSTSTLPRENVKNLMKM